MKKLLLTCAFIVGVSLALLNFQGLAVKGEFDSIIINFRQDISQTELEYNLSAIASQLKQVPILNSIFFRRRKNLHCRGR